MRVSFLPVYILCEHGIILERCDIDWSSYMQVSFRSSSKPHCRLTTLPPPNQPRTPQLAALFRRQPRLNNGVLCQKLVKLWHALEQVAERQEATIDRPGGPACSAAVPILADEQVTCLDLVRTRNNGIETNDGGVGDAVQEAKTEPTSNWWKEIVNQKNLLLMTILLPRSDVTNEVNHFMDTWA